MTGFPLSGRRLALMACAVTALLASSLPLAHSAGDFSKDFRVTDLGPKTLPVDFSQYRKVSYVSRTAGSDTTGNGSISKPWSTIGKAISAIRDAGPSNRCAVLVSSGVYSGATIAMKPYVDIYGGFAPRSQVRDIYAHRSILDGRGVRRVVLGADNSRLDGFVIRGGVSRGHGGAILCDRTSPEITNNVFVGNSTREPKDYIRGLLHQVGSEGGAIACVNAASPRIANNIFHGNTTAIGGGGAIACRNYSLPVIENNVIADNITGTGDNDPDKAKRARSSNGAGISCSEALFKDTTRLRMANNLIINNSVGGNSDAGGVYCEYDSYPDILGNAILGNSAEDDGGAIYVMKSSEPLISGNYVAGSKGGGAIRLSKEGRARMDGNIVACNPAGGIKIVDSWAILTNNTIVDNADDGIWYDNLNLPIKPSIIKDNIVWGNAGRSLVIGAPEPPVSANNTFENKSDPQSPPAFRNDGVTGTAISMVYDPVHFRTTFRPAAGLNDAGELLGRIVLVGEKWSVICGADSRSLTVWGDVPVKDGKPSDFEILKTYSIAE